MKYSNLQIATQPSNAEVTNKQTNLNAELLRFHIHKHLKQQPWNLNQQQLCQYFNHYQPMQVSNINVKALFNITNTRLIRNENKIYFGGIDGKKKHGKGITINKDGKIYEGDYYNNEKHGYGCEIYSNGNIYFGGFQRDKKHGRGTIYWFNITKSQPTQERFIESYEGDWWGGLPDGEGKHQRSNGDYYVGNFKNGLKHGNGVQKYANGDEYKGTFINGFPEGYGQYIFADGRFYKGDFKQGFRNGFGIEKKSKTSIQSYKGNYKLNEKHGYGIYDWGDGYVYKGQFQHNIRTGKGQLYLNNELIYDGQWKNGKNSDNFDPDFKRKRIIKTNKNKSHQQSSKIQLFKNSYHLKSNSYSRKKKQQVSTDNQTFKKLSFSHLGHKSCVPNQEIGKMPKNPWEILKYSRKGNSIYLKQTKS